MNTLVSDIDCLFLFFASRTWIDKANAGVKAVQVPSGSRELCTVAAMSQYLGFEAFKSFAEAQSLMLTDDVHSAIDSVTTVSISADVKLLMHGFDPKSAVKIEGFSA